MSECTLFQLFHTKAAPFSVERLKSSYHALMRKVHPDMPSSLSPREREGLSGFIGQAYAKLKNDYTRNLYRYALENKQNLVKKELHSVGEVFGMGDTLTVIDTEKEAIGCKKKVPQDFLDRMLSLEDQITSGASEDRASARKEIEEEIEECKRNSGSAEHLIRWRYFARLLEHLRKEELLE